MTTRAARPLHEAMQYTKAEGNACDCFLCSHRCRVPPGKRGICRVRENREGALYSLVYGMLVAGHVDPIEKKPLYHFMPGTKSMSIATTGCNFQCDFCQNWQISQDYDAHIPGEYTTPEEIVAEAKANHCPSISYTYTEPTIFFEYAHDCARLAHAEGMKNCFVTNGYETPETIEVMAGLIDAANVDLKAFSEDFYRQRCKARLEPVCEAIKLMHRAAINIEVTTLLIPGFNDSDEELKRLAAFLVSVSDIIPWHVSRYHPDYKFDQAHATPPEQILHALGIGRQAGLKYLYAGNMPGGDFVNTRCHTCGAVVIERHGFSARTVGLDGTSCASCGQKLPVVV